MRVNFEDTDLDRLADRVVEKLTPHLQYKDNGKDKFLNVKELAEYIGQKPSWIYAHIQEIPHTKKGGFLVFKKSVIDKWLEPDYQPHLYSPLVLNRKECSQS
ncbi:MAG: helix-turn-helix domain-containing protein [Candidatus Brocadiales bacterium]